MTGSTAGSGSLERLLESAQAALADLSKVTVQYRNLKEASGAPLEQQRLAESMVLELQLGGVSVPLGAPPAEQREAYIVQAINSLGMRIIQGWQELGEIVAAANQQCQAAAERSRQPAPPPQPPQL